VLTRERLIARDLSPGKMLISLAIRRALFQADAVGYRAMDPFVAALLGVVEGVTEYLPVSSTGHLILAGRLLGMAGEGDKSFEIVIQLGAILAVLVHYRSLLGKRLGQLVSREPEAMQLWSSLVIGFLPVAVLGLALRTTIKTHLFGPLPVAAALIVGGAFMILLEARRRRKQQTGLEGLEHVGPGRALLIGLGQCVSLWPGASRSMCTIVAGQLSGLSTATAAEFSFLLALPTLGAATLYELFRARHVLFDETGRLSLAIGLGASFVVAWMVIAAFLRYLKSHGLAPFGYYRLVVGAVVLWLMRA
jgi:undecaprenyl-diphosphatase